MSSRMRHIVYTLYFSLYTLNIALCIKFNKIHAENKPPFFRQMGGWMLRKILSFFFALFMLLPVAHSAEMVNVEYIHNVLRWRWGIELPYNPELENPKVAANMEYLLTVVDIANEYLNGGKTTSYGTGEYATKLAADTIATNKAIDGLIRGPGFYITTVPGTAKFDIMINAAGNFAIDWGDGERESIVDKAVGDITYSHTFGNPQRANTIRITGTSTDYAYGVVALSFPQKTSIAKISGNLGKIFPTLPDGTQPRFSSLFNGATNMTGEIPPQLFDGLYGATEEYMFSNVFTNCSKLTGEIPPDLFAGITGPLAMHAFENTFRNCSGLTGEIPETLFSRIKSEPIEFMFNQTFFGCSGLTGSIPENLFAGIAGAPAAAMFFGTFRGCSGIKGAIPENLFAGISGAPAGSCFGETFAFTGVLGKIPENLFAGVRGAPAEQMFSSTFMGCRGLSGGFPEKLFAGISGAPAANMFSGTFYQCSGLGGAIPENLFGNISGAPAAGMFSYTFCDSGLSSIPAGLFAGISGAPAENMFDGTFNWNLGLKSIPDGLFAGISGAPAANMFRHTFYYTRITDIPENLFGNISGEPADGMFDTAFANCSALTGPSARINGQYLYEIWPDISSDTNTYEGSTGLSDYDQIPDNWK